MAAPQQDSRLRGNDDGPTKQSGYVLLPVAIAIALIGMVAFLTSSESAIDVIRGAANVRMVVLRVYGSGLSSFPPHPPDGQGFRPGSIVRFLTDFLVSILQYPEACGTGSERSS